MWEQEKKKKKIKGGLIKRTKDFHKTSTFLFFFFLSTSIKVWLKVSKY